MSDQYVGEIRMFSGNYTPQGWAMCNGQILNIAENEVLYTLIGTTYGGDGKTTFGLPDLRGRLPIHTGNGYALGSFGGTETVTLSTAQLPSHTHPVSVSNSPGTSDSPSNAYWASSTINRYANTASNGIMDPGTISPVGGSGEHDNIMPYAVLTFIIALVGIYPTQG